MWLNTATVYSIHTSCRKYETADLRLLASYQTSRDLGLDLCVVAREALNRRWCNGKQKREYLLAVMGEDSGILIRFFCFNFTVINFIFNFILSEYFKEENIQNETFFQEKNKTL